MQIHQSEITITAPGRGFYLITSKVEKALSGLSIGAGLLNLFLQHTSASLTINENADPDVRGDLERYFRNQVPDGADYFSHTLEGADDMSAHIKSSILGSSLQVPVRGGRLALGTWQGIYLCEHRSAPAPRRILLTILGE